MAADQTLPLRTCTNCANVLIFTYTCQTRPDSKQSLRDFTTTMSKPDSTWHCICRACRSIQILRRNELICSRDQLCRALNTRMGLLDRVMPAHPRPRTYGNAGKVTLEDLRPIVGRATGG